MQLGDLINTIFEASGGFFVLLSVMRTYKEKQVKGISVFTIGFFTSWGYWNLFYYPSLGQTWSGIAALGVALTNTLWLLQILYYQKKSREIEQISCANSASSGAR